MTRPSPPQPDAQPASETSEALREWANTPHVQLGLSPRQREVQQLFADRDALAARQKRLEWYESLQGDANDADFASIVKEADALERRVADLEAERDGHLDLLRRVYENERVWRVLPNSIAGDLFAAVEGMRSSTLDSLAAPGSAQPEATTACETCGSTGGLGAVGGDGLAVGARETAALLVTVRDALTHTHGGKVPCAPCEPHAALDALETRLVEADEAAMVEILVEHFPIEIRCDHEKARDKPICNCGRTQLGWWPNVRQAKEAWARHVVAALTHDAHGSPEREPAQPDETEGR